jgi:type II secretory pathway pseudopilin PulG
MRLLCESGLGLVELIVAMVVLNVALLALLAAFATGASSLQRTSRASTAAALASTQLDRYRALTYTSIALDSTALATANGDSVYLGDHPRDSGGNLQADFGASCPSLPRECNPRFTLVGPDHLRYRVDTYVTQVTPAGGRAGKQVTVVVRDGTRPGQALTRVTSIFDQALG